MVCARRWYQWRLPEVMIERELFPADLVRLMAARGIGLSAVQAWRLATRTPAGLSLTVLAGLCDALGVTPSELITVSDSSRSRHARPGAADGAALSPGHQQGRCPPVNGRCGRVDGVGEERSTNGS